MDKNKFYRDLVRRYADNRATSDELEAFFHLIREGELESALTEEMNTTAGIDEVETHESVPIITKRQLPFWWRAAAIVTLIIGATIAGLTVWHNRKQNNAQTETARNIREDVAPGSNKAILTLSNGTKVILDSATNGNLTTQGNSNVVKLESGKLAYQVNRNGQRFSAIVYNTLTTPRGGQYQLMLPDGSKVWLDAASSITYPTSFKGKERKVQISGQAYFDIVHDDKMPFIVAVNGTTIRDIGTAFNVNAYADEPVMKTTLINGEIEVRTNNQSNKLKPGEQLQVNANGQMKMSNDVDLEQVMAWKNGRFRFNSVDIQSIMRQASRWYDVDVEYKGKINETFSGGISRNVNASQLLHILELTGKVNFEINGKKIIVKPK